MKPVNAILPEATGFHIRTVIETEDDGEAYTRCIEEEFDDDMNLLNTIIFYEEAIH